VIGTVAVWGVNYQLGPAGLLGVVLLTSTVLAPLHALCLALPRFEQCSKSLEQINAFMNAQSEAATDNQHRRLPVIRGNAALRNITMRIGAGGRCSSGSTFRSTRATSSASAERPARANPPSCICCKG
jgi:ABC-type bacteriocin/lantibiotic exporter with double-glycine peptidase domain